MIYLKNESELSELLKKDKVLLDFYADWCGPCKMLGTILEEIDKENLGIEIVKIDTDNFISLARKYKVLSIPNLKYFENGNLEKEQTGFLTKEELLAWLNLK